MFTDITTKLNRKRLKNNVEVLIEELQKINMNLNKEKACMIILTANKVHNMKTMRR